MAPQPNKTWPCSVCPKAYTDCVKLSTHNNLNPQGHQGTNQQHTTMMISINQPSQQTTKAWCQSLPACRVAVPYASIALVREVPDSKLLDVMDDQQVWSVHTLLHHNMSDICSWNHFNPGRPTQNTRILVVSKGHIFVRRIHSLSKQKSVRSPQ